MPTLIDRFGRAIHYLRLSVTDRCDLRCRYCLPDGFHDFETPDHWLNFDEIERVVRIFTGLGVRRVRLTGGEPLVRRNLATLAQRLHALPDLTDLSLSTNGTQLEKQAGALRAAGVSRVNLSLDTLQPARFTTITGGGRLERVLAGLAAARAAGFHPIKINMVVMRGVNEDEIEDMVEFCLRHDYTLRLIETMPMGDTGRDAARHYLGLDVVRARLAKRFDLVPALMSGDRGGGPARYVQVAGADLRIGFITPLSQHFCATCNRVRLAVDGTLYLCLGQDDKLELRPLLRAGASDDALESAIVAAIARKPERHEFREQPERVIRFMAKTGG